MIIRGSLTHTGRHLSVDDMLAYLSDLLIDVHIYKQTPRHSAGTSGTVEWVCILHNCDYVSTNAYLIGQAFWLSYRKFITPLHAADPHSTAAMSLELQLPHGETRRFTLGRTQGTKEEFLCAMAATLRQISREECMRLSKADASLGFTRNWDLVKA